MNPASATAIFAIILLIASTGALPFQDVQDQQEYPADSHKKPCPAEYEEYCLNGGKCFTVTVAGITTGPACQCVLGYSGTRCQSRSLHLDLLDYVFRNGLEKVDIAQYGDHTSPCSSGNDILCLNGGTCFVVNLGGGRVSNPSCRCTSKFTGRRCEYQSISDPLEDHNWVPHVDIAQHTSPCPPGNENYCLNGGTCFKINLGGGRACHCTSNFTGKRCEYQSISDLGDHNTVPHNYPGGR